MTDICSKIDLGRFHRFADQRGYSVSEISDNNENGIFDPGDKVLIDTKDGNGPQLMKFENRKVQSIVARAKDDCIEKTKDTTIFISMAVAYYNRVPVLDVVHAVGNGMFGNVSVIIGEGSRYLKFGSKDGFEPLNNLSEYPAPRSAQNFPLSTDMDLVEDLMCKDDRCSGHLIYIVPSDKEIDCNNNDHNTYACQTAAHLRARGLHLSLIELANSKSRLDCETLKEDNVILTGHGKSFVDDDRYDFVQFKEKKPSPARSAERPTLDNWDVSAVANEIACETSIEESKKALINSIKNALLK